MVTRVLAVLAAVAMVVGAIVVRANLDNNGAGGTTSPTTLRIVCATELAAVCEALDGQVGTTVEDASTTAARLTTVGDGQEPPLDGWLVTAPWPEIVDGARSRAGSEPFLDVGDVLARSPVVLAVNTTRSKVLAARCNAEVGWKCVGDAAGVAWQDLPNGRPEWGPVKVGHPPATTAGGLTIAGAAAVGYFDGSTDLSATELADRGFQNWLRRLESGPQIPGSPLLTMLSRPSAFDVVGALEAEAGPAIATASATKPVLLYPSPVATADVVLATSDGGAGRRVAELLAGTAARRALAAAGWRVDGVPPAAGIRTSVKLPTTSNLPEPDVLDALRSAVEQAGR